MKKEFVLLAFLIILTLYTASFFGQSPAQIQQQVFVFKEVLGPGTKVGVLCNIINHQRDLRSLTVLSKAYKIPIYFYNVANLTDLNKGIDLLVQSKQVNAILVLPNDLASTNNGIKFLVKKCSEKNIKLLSADPSAIANGALMSVISDGSGVKLLVNKNVASQVGLTIPATFKAKVKYF